MVNTKVMKEKEYPPPFQLKKKVDYFSVLKLRENMKYQANKNCSKGKMGTVLSQRLLNPNGETKISSDI